MNMHRDCKILREVLEKVISAIKGDYITLRRKNSLCEFFVNIIVNKNTEYTAYDFFMDIASLPPRIKKNPNMAGNMCSESLRKLREVGLREILDFDYHQLGREVRSQIAKQ